MDWKEWTDYLTNSLFLDDQSLDTTPPGTYGVVIPFVVNKKGRIGDVAVTKDPGFGLGQRVKKVLDKYHGNWQPARLNGRAISSYKRRLKIVKKP